MKQLSICRPDDWHLHLRDGKMLAAVIDDTSRHFGPGDYYAKFNSTGCDWC